MANQNSRELARENLDLSKAVPNGVKKYQKQISSIESQLAGITNWMSDVEKNYVIKNPAERDGFDIAFGKLNPESASKANKYQKLLNKKIELENEMVNLNSARDYFNTIYSEAKHDVNQAYDNQNLANTTASDIALAQAQAQANGMGATGIQSAGLKAQASNLLANQQLQTQAQRTKDLASITQQEAQVPVILSQIAATNASITAQKEANATGGGSSGRQRHSYGGWGGNYTKTTTQDKEFQDKIKALGAKQNPDGSWTTADGYTFDWQYIKNNSLEDIQKVIGSESKTSDNSEEGTKTLPRIDLRDKQRPKLQKNKIFNSY